MKSAKLRKLPKFYIFLFLFLFIFQQFSTGVVQAAASIPAPPIVNANAVVVLDGRTGTELFSKNPETVIRTDSILPMLIAMVVLDERQPDDFILVTKESAGMSTGITGTKEKTGLKTGERLTVRQLLSSVLLANSQDACKALSGIYASEDLFLERIQAKITTLGLTDTVVSSYLVKEDSTDHTTVQAMARIMQEFLTYPLLVELSHQPAYTFVPNNMVPEPRLITNTNKQIDSQAALYFDKATAGFPSNSNAEAVPFNLFVSAAQTETGQFIVALSDSPKITDNYTNSKSLFDWAFTNYKAVRLIAKGEVMSNLPLSNGVTLNLLSKQDFYYLGSFADTFKPEFSLNFKPLDITGELIEKNQVMGSADIVINDKVQGSVELLSSEAISLAETSLASPEPSLLSKLLKGLIWIILGLSFIGLLILIIRTFNFYRRSKKKQQELRLKRESLQKNRQAEQGRKAKQQVINRSNF